MSIYISAFKQNIYLCIVILCAKGSFLCVFNQNNSPIFIDFKIVDICLLGQ